MFAAFQQELVARSETQALEVGSMSTLLLSVASKQDRQRIHCQAESGQSGRMSGLLADVSAKQERQQLQHQAQSTQIESLRQELAVLSAASGAQQLEVLELKRQVVRSPGRLFTWGLTALQLLLIFSLCFATFAPHGPMSYPQDLSSPSSPGMFATPPQREAGIASLHAQGLESCLPTAKSFMTNPHTATALTKKVQSHSSSFSSEWKTGTNFTPALKGPKLSTSHVAAATTTIGISSTAAGPCSGQNPISHFRKVTTERESRSSVATPYCCQEPISAEIAPEILTPGSCQEAATCSREATTPRDREQPPERLRGLYAVTCAVLTAALPACLQKMFAGFLEAAFGIMWQLLHEVLGWSRTAAVSLAEVILELGREDLVTIVTQLNLAYRLWIFLSYRLAVVLW